MRHPGVILTRHFGPGVRSGRANLGQLNAWLKNTFGWRRVGRGLLSGLYAVGGGGVYYFRNYTNTLNITTNPGTAGGVGQGNQGGSVTNVFNAEDKTQFGANVGGGIQFGIGNASLFVESRYVRIFTPNRNTDMVPVAAGLTFNW